MNRTVRITLKNRKRPIIVSGYLELSGREEDDGFQQEVYGLSPKGVQIHLDFDDIVKMEPLLNGKSISTNENQKETSR